APSGSCAGMLKLHYPALLSADPEWSGKAKAFAERVYELISFLVDVRGMESVDADFLARVTDHDSCSGLPKLGLEGPPRPRPASASSGSRASHGGSSPP